MSNHHDQDDNIPKGHIKLKEGIDIQSLLEGKGDTFEIRFEDVKQDDEEDGPFEQDKEQEDEIIRLTALCMGAAESDEDDGDVDTNTPFENLALRMKNVTEDGKIKKKIKKEGVGSTPPANSLVSIKYSSYLEHLDEPTDTAHMSKPFQFRLGNAGIFGLNIAVQSMKTNEIAWFLIHPDYAYGRMGHPPRIPPNATFLFYIHLLNFFDSGPALQLEEISNEDKRKFPNVQSVAHGLMESAREHFKRNKKLAIRDYNKAMTLLEECTLNNMEEQEKQQKLLCKIYTNLAVCYTQENIPKKACSMCNNIYAMTRNTSLQVPAKVYFHNGRALKMLGEYKLARERLSKAVKLEPFDKIIIDELKLVTNKLAEETNREKNFARAFIYNNEPNSTSQSPSIPLNENNVFRSRMRKQCQELKQNPDRNEFKLASGLCKEEWDIAKDEAQRAGLFFREESVDYSDDESGSEDASGHIIYSIAKY